MASSASLIVTPFMLRAVTSRPRGKCRSIFLTGGVVSIFFKVSGSPIEVGEVLSFLQAKVSMLFLNNTNITMGGRQGSPTLIPTAQVGNKMDSPVQLLGLLRNHQLNPFLLYSSIKSASSH